MFVCVCQDMYEMSGTNYMRENFGDAFSYENSPLAKIYRRDHNKSTSIKSILNLMRSNSFKRDPLSLGNPRCAIGARGDIPNKVSNSFPIGVIDSKIISLEKKLENVTSNDTTTNNNNNIIPFNNNVSNDELIIFKAVAGPAHSLHKNSENLKGNDEIRKEKNETVEVEGVGVGVGVGGGVGGGDDDTLKPFNWQNSVFNEFPHNGHPNNWDFDAISLSP